MATPRALKHAWINITLHLILIALHILALLLPLFGVGDQTVRGGMPAQALSLSTNTISQVIGTLYTALLVMLTQKLALRGDLQAKATLTALHDRSSAWLGLVSSISTLYTQLKLSSGWSTVARIMLYLLCVTVLHTTTPTLFTVAPAGQHPATYLSSSLANIIPARFPPDGSLTRERLYPMLSAASPIPNYSENYGIYQNIILDTPIPPAYENISSLYQGFVNISATKFDTTCRTVQEASITNITHIHGLSYIRIYAGESLGTVTIPMSLSPLTIMQGTNPQAPANTQNTDDSMFPINNPSFSWIVVSSVDVGDHGSFASGSITEMPLPALVMPSGGHIYKTGNFTSPLLFHVLACTLAAYNGTTTNTYPSLLTPRALVTNGIRYEGYQKTSKSFPGPWTPQVPAEQRGDNLVRWLSTLAPLEVPLANEDGTQCEDFIGLPSGLRYKSCYALTELDRYVIQCLRTESPNGFSTGALDICVSQAAALLAWAGKHLRWRGVPRESTNERSTETLSGARQVPVEWREERYELQNNLWSCYGGLIISCILFLLALSFTRASPEPTELHKELGNPGVLQLAWLMGQRPESPDLVGLSQVQEPTLQALREKGMFGLDMTHSTRGTTPLQKT